MGVFPMSLINQMLQELDARRSEASGVNTYGQQVRAVPQHKRIHPAWWVALALGIALIALLAWLLLRPVPDAGQGAGQQAPLKLDTSLNAPSPLQPAPLQRTAPLDMKAESTPAMPSPEKPAALPVTPVQVLQIKEEPALSVPEVVKAPTRTPATAPAPVPVKAAVPESPLPLQASTPVAITKQVKELSAQQRAENEYRKATQLLQQGRSAEAMSSLEQALQLDSLHAGARQTLIGLLLENKRTDEAVQLAKQGIDLDPAQPGLAMILARLQLEKGELRTAIGTLERTLAHATDRADYHAFLAALLQRDGQHKQAAEQYLLALQKAPQSGVWWMGLGISLQAEQRTAEAQEAFKRAKSSNSLSPELLAFVEGRLAQLQR